MAKKTFAEQMAASAKRQNKAKKSPGIFVDFVDPFGKPKRELTVEDFKKHDQMISNEMPLVKSVLNSLQDPDDTIERLGFEMSPVNGDKYTNLYIRKPGTLLPDATLKRMAIQDDLIAAVINTRANQISSFGRPQPDRFSTGFKIEPEPGYTEHLSEEQKQQLQDRISTAERLLLSCGSTKNVKDQDFMSLGMFLFMQARNACVFGRMATEFTYITTGAGKKFHSMRPLDAGTIYQATPHKEQTKAIRERALNLLQTLRNKKLKPEKYVADEYAYIQVCNGIPVQAFTSEECNVHNFYPVTDIELMGYPVSPMDTIVAAIVTHINITTHNRLYFQSGRAAKGMVVIKSDDINQTKVSTIRKHFSANINGVQSAWRTPVFGVGTDDDISWQSIDAGGRDMEFQYLSDTTSRVILGAYQMGPEEITSLAHLSRGTNSQALGESNTEWKLEAARDVGLRPFMAHFQSFVNESVFPLIDEELSKHCTVKFVGLDAETAEKESQRLAAEAEVHMVYDEIMEKVEKQAIGKRWGGRMPLNPSFQSTIEKYLTFGEIREHFFGVEGASKDPALQFYQNPMWLNWMQIQQAQQQAPQEAQQQPPAQGQGGQEGDSEVGSAIDQAVEGLSKGEEHLPANKRHLLKKQKELIASSLAHFDAETKAAIKNILELSQKHL